MLRTYALSRKAVMVLYCLTGRGRQGERANDYTEALTDTRVTTQSLSTIDPVINGSPKNQSIATTSSILTF